MKRALVVLFVLTICSVAPAYAEKARVDGTNIPSSVTPWYQSAVVQLHTPATPPAVDKTGPSRVKATDGPDCIACAVYSISETYRDLWWAVAGLEGTVKFVAGCTKYCPIF